MKNVLVTGGNGFIGGYVVEELQAREHQVYVLDRKRPRVTADGFFWGDIKDPTLVTDAVSHVDGVVHLAGVLGTQETIDNPRPAAETNILGGINVIEACAQYDVPLVNIAVGNFWMDNTYSITKNTVERLVRMTAKYRGKSMVSVRALNAYGPRQVPIAPYGPSRVRKIMPSFICRALTGEPIEVYGDGSQIMDMIYVKDVAGILVTVLDALDSGSVVDDIEAGTGNPTTVLDIAEEVATAVLALDGRAVTVTNLPMRPGEDPASVVLGNPETLRQFGIDPAELTSLSKGVYETVAYFQEFLGDR
jgi:UDP-glucose 4-epimerase